MDKKEAFQHIIYNLKEIESTRLRLNSAKPELMDIEMALLNQQVVNLYRHLQNYQSGLYASAPAEPQPAKAEILFVPAPQPAMKQEVQQEVQQEVYYEPVTARQTEIPVPKEPDTELKRDNKDAQQRKERLKRLEDEAAKMEATRKEEAAAPAPAPITEMADFTKIVEEEYQRADIAEEAAKVSGLAHEPRRTVIQANAGTEPTLNEKLQSGKKLPESLNDKFNQGENKKTLAEKMKLGPITDLKSAMALNQKIAFTNGLFSGDDKEFKKALTFLNNCRNFSEAKIYLQHEIGTLHGWEENDPLVEEFTELVYRKFL